MRQNLLGHCRRWAHTIGGQAEQPYDFSVDANDVDGDEQHIEPILMALSHTLVILTEIYVFLIISRRCSMFKGSVAEFSEYGIKSPDLAPANFNFKLDGNRHQSYL
jgi:hypothetical protein